MGAMLTVSSRTTLRSAAASLLLHALVVGGVDQRGRPCAATSSIAGWRRWPRPTSTRSDCLDGAGGHRPAAGVGLRSQ